ncbi:hypothetical protein LTR37_008315 [Vermiconidia calcicola]|uniref:Uncharacterized protein n=1 Tax=Vermiconidia calcicola TaxID=1690605 RepID=A0ACC3NCG6_9PEZI|nr:hypothetical protein LTR37_008315 [Vermiconidia calcicola]
MPHHVPWNVTVQSHPGSADEDVNSEVDWHEGHQHRIGYKNRDDRVPGLTHHDDDHEDVVGSRGSGTKDASYQNGTKATNGNLSSFRDIVGNRRNHNVLNAKRQPNGWRDVFEYTEDWVKYTEEWPVNTKRKEGQAETNGSSTNAGSSGGDPDEQNQETDWNRQNGVKDKHNEAYATAQSEPNQEHGQETEYERLSKRYTPQEIALLRALQHEKDYRQGLQQNEGKQQSPQTHNKSSVAINVKDQFTPDNWLPRSDHLIRLTSNHPFNAEAELSALYQAGLITPNELHYVRNHGAVPRLLWRDHKLDVENGRLILSMDDLANGFESVNIPIAIACDGNRRKEMNMTKKSKGFNWGASAVGCAYWKGALLRDVLLAAGVEEEEQARESWQQWVNFGGADDPSEGTYETCIPLSYAMDPANDVLLAYEMNNLPLPPDHGYPLRLVIPGYIGGRNVKWLARVWLSESENSSYYHIWDNRVLPSFITEKDGEFAKTMFHHPDTACNEQNLNSVIVKPAQGERLSLAQAKKGETYRIEGYAYDGGGHEVQRVEVSLDEGHTWLYCIRKFPERPIRHGSKFWSWLHWHVDVSLVHLLQAKSVAVRAWNVFKNTQPRELTWNIMGMMNNCWYVVKTEIDEAQDADPFVMFRHPCEPTGDEGWMKSSVENQIQSAKQEAGTPSKQFTRQEIEKHDKEDDCWLVVDGKVYDATSVLSWHPGGKAAVLGHAGKVHQDTSDEFASIHDGFAYQKLHECALGVVTEKAANFIKAQAEAAKKEESKKHNNEDVALQKSRWVPVALEGRDELSEDTRRYTFKLLGGAKDLGLETCQHLQIGIHMKDKMLIRSYTPTAPLLPESTKAPVSGEVRKMRDGQGMFQVVIKTYFPSDDVPGGALSNILDCVPIGEQVDIRGPMGDIAYKGEGRFVIEGKERKFQKISLVLGGSGITPGFALLARVVGCKENAVQVRVVDANKTEKDILLHDELDRYEKESQGRLEIIHILSHPRSTWNGLKGHIGPEIIKEHLFPPDEDSVVFLCGPPAMIQKAALPALKDWGYVEDQNLFGF